MKEYYFKIVYMENQNFTTHKETKIFKSQETASNYFYKLLKDYKVNYFNKVPTYSYCQMGVVV